MEEERQGVYLFMIFECLAVYVFKLADRHPVRASAYSKTYTDKHSKTILFQVAPFPAVSFSLSGQPKENDVERVN